MEYVPPSAADPESSAPRVLGYARLSLNRDGTKTGTRRQSADLRVLAERDGWTLDVLEEDDRSAFGKAPRPVFERFLVELGSAKYDGAALWKLDRGFRQNRDLERFLSVVEDGNLFWVSQRDGLDSRLGGDPELMARIAVHQANRESRNTSIRQQAKQRELREAGRWHGGGKRAYGLSADWSAIVPDEADRIREAARRVLAGEGIMGVCRDFDTRGIRTVRGGHWRPSSLREMLGSWRLAGARSLTDESDPTRVPGAQQTSDGTWIVASGNIPAILDIETVDRLRRRLRGRQRSGEIYRNYLLSGFLVCGVCGHRLRSRPHISRGARFGCVKPPSGSGCGTVTVQYAPLEALISETVLYRLEHPETLSGARRGSHDHQSDAAELEGVRERLEQLSRDFYADGIISRAEFLAAREPLNDRAAELERRLADTPVYGVVSSLGADVRTYWDAAPLSSRRALVGLVVESIIVHPATKPGVWDDGRIEVRWRV